MTSNLYIHFPFCRRKCSYCALHSRGGVPQEVRDRYVQARVADLKMRTDCGKFSTVYFGGGSPALCDLQPLLAELRPRLTHNAEFTVELHPLDVSRTLLTTLRDGGVNRISMGVQSVEDDVLRAMRRGYTFDEAERAFALVKDVFDNAGIDLIVGYPGESPTLLPRHARLANWGLRHCSVYSLILEEKSILFHQLHHQGDKLAQHLGTDPRSKGNKGDSPPIPNDDETLNRLGLYAQFLADFGIERYEIANYSIPGFECRHNFAVWRGEDYLGLGEGASGRLGLIRTYNPPGDRPQERVVMTAEEDRKERTIFRLRTREGLDTSEFPHWRETLDKFVKENILVRKGNVYYLTRRGYEVCDSVLVEIV